MTPSGQLLLQRGDTVGMERRNGFSLLEILLVASIIGLLLAITVPGLVALSPSRKTAIHEVSGFLESARARAMAAQAEMIVAFADGSFPGESGPYRAYALFALEGAPPDDPGKGLVRQVSPWRILPEGLVFGQSEHFEVQNGIPFRTILDAPARRSFPVSGPELPGVESEMVVLPFLLFGSDGGIRVPAFTDADALHVGIVEGYFDPRAGSLELTATRPGENGTGRFANGECLQVGYYTGRSRILTD